MNRESVASLKIYYEHICVIEYLGGRHEKH